MQRTENFSKDEKIAIYNGKNFKLNTLKPIIPEVLNQRKQPNKN